MPASQIDVEYVEDTESYVGMTVDSIILEIKPMEHKLIMSGKMPAKEKAMAEKNNRIGRLAEGSDVEGVVGIVSKPGADIADLINKNWGKGIKILIAEDNTMTIDCNIIISYGQSVVDIAQAVQAAIINAVESMTGVKVAAVNVNVCGIVRK